MQIKLWEALRWVAVLCVIVLLFTMCSGKPNSNQPVEAVEKAVCASLDLSTMQAADRQMVKRFYHLQPGDYEGCVLYAPTTNMGAEELLIVKLKDPAQAETVRAAIETRIEEQKSFFDDGYGVEQFDLLTNHCIVEVRGNYVLFVVNKDADAARQAFLKAL